ncbi:MAG: hypothetical protein WD601_03755 [Pseudohongiellaceae bacterium]
MSGYPRGTDEDEFIVQKSFRYRCTGHQARNRLDWKEPTRRAPMMIESPQRLPGVSLVAMLVAAALAIWLLVQPGLLQSLSLPWRLPLILLGVWALGSAFMQGVGVQARAGWFRRVTSPPWSHGALLGFTLVILVRAWMV